MKTLEDRLRIARKMVGQSFVRVVENIKAPEIYPVRDNDEMLSVLYAPDPVTGLPCSNAALLYKDKDKPEVQEYIQKRLFQVRQSVAGAESADDAIQAIRGYHEDLASFGSRLRDNFFKPSTPVESEV